MVTSSAETPPKLNGAEIEIAVVDSPDHVANDDIEVLMLPWIHIQCHNQNPTSVAAEAIQQVGSSSPSYKLAIVLVI